MEKQKGFIQIPLLVAIIAGVLVFGGTGYVGVKQYQNHQIEVERENNQSTSTPELSEVEKLKQEVEELKKKTAGNTNGSSQMDRKNQDVNPLITPPTSPKPPATIPNTDSSNVVYMYITGDTQMWSATSETPIGNVAKGTKVILIKKASGFSTVEISDQTVLVLTDYLADSTTPNIDISEVVDKWKPYSVYIFCEFKYTDGTTYLKQSCSGTDYDGVVITNRHVITDEKGYGPSSCSLKFPGSNHVFIVPNSEIRTAINGDDWGTITVSDKKSYIDNKPLSGMYGCYGKKPTEGDEVVIIGYPSIGSQTGITVTRGIISGLEGNYFITDAKIDHGNSGGTAILMRGDCYLGIPTYGIKGELESLGRILDIRAVPIVGRG